MTPRNETRRPLTAVGFLPFGKGYNAPLAALDVELDRFSAANREHNALTDALVVLPEAFNIGKAYYDSCPPSIDPSFLDELSERSLVHHCAFVAGVIVDDSPGISPPYSSAYLVDGAAITLLSRKASRDNTEATCVRHASYAANYTAFPDFYSQVVRHRDTAIAALVCLDGQYEHGATRSVYASQLEQVALSLEHSDCAHKLLCIPARVSNGFCNGQTGQNVAFNTPWNGIVQILSNGLPAPVASFVTNSNSLIQAQTGPRQDNRIELFQLTDLTAQRS